MQANALPNDIRPCNIYIISRQPKISIAPESVKLDEEFSATFRIQNEDSYTEIDVTAPALPGFNGSKWISKWPHEEFQVVDKSGHVIFAGIAALLLTALRSHA